MACGCGGMKKKRQQEQSARQIAAAKPVEPGVRRRGELTPGSTWNGRTEKPAS